MNPTFEEIAKRCKRTERFEEIKQNWIGTGTDTDFLLQIIEDFKTALLFYSHRNQWWSDHGDTARKALREIGEWVK